MKVQVIYDFHNTNPEELSVKEGEVLTIVDQTIGEGWWSAINSKGLSGLVPSSYVKQLDSSVPAGYSEQSLTDDWDSDDDSPEPPHSVIQTNPEPPSTVIPDSNRLSVIRKGLGNVSGAEDYLLQLNPPENIHPISYIDYKDGLFRWRPNDKVVTCVIGQYTMNSKLLGMKSFTNYRLTSSLNNLHVDRRYKHFEWLYDRLHEKLLIYCCPALPEKSITNKFVEAFIEERRTGLMHWINHLCDHPVASKTSVVEHFLSCSDAARWKAGKRSAESDPIRFIRFFYTVQSNDGPVQEDSTLKSLGQTETFITRLLQSIRAFLNKLKEFHQKMSTNTSKDFLNLSETLFSLAGILNTDVYGKDLVISLVPIVSTVGHTLKDFSLHYSVRSEAIKSLIDMLDFYCNLLGRFSSVLVLGRNACITSEEAKRFEFSGKISRSDSNTIQVGCRVITRSVQAECNHVFDKLRKDFTQLFGGYLRDQAAFYRKMADELDGVAASFNV